MDPSLRFSVGDTLDPVDAAFELHVAENVFPLYLKNDLVEPADLSWVGVHHFNLPALVYGVTGVCPVEIGGEDPGFGATGARPNLQDYVTLVVGVFRQQGQTKGLRRIFQLGLGYFYFLFSHFDQFRFRPVFDQRL